MKLTRCYPREEFLLPYVRLPRVAVHGPTGANALGQRTLVQTEERVADPSEANASVATLTRALEAGSATVAPRSAGDLLARMKAALKRSLLLVAPISLVILQGCASIGSSHNPPSEAIPASATDDLSRIASQNGMKSGESAFRPLPIGAFALDARLTLIEHAQHSLDVQYYLLQDDDTGRLFLRALRDAAMRGVRIRLLVDDFYTSRSDSLLLNFSAVPNVEVRLFNPFPIGRASDITRWGLSLFDIPRLNRRMHNKLLVADGAMAVVGGRNIADEYFLRSEGGNFVDFDLLTVGAAVSELAASFDRYWNSPRVFSIASLNSSSVDVDTRRKQFDEATTSATASIRKLSRMDKDLLGYGPLSGDIEQPPLKMRRGKIRVMADDPEKVSGRAQTGIDQTTVTSQLLSEITNAKQELLLVSPYFVPGELGMSEIKKGRDQGVSITLVTNSLASNDEPLVSAAFARYRRRLLKMGVQIFEISPGVLRSENREHASSASSTGRLHVKGAVIDRRLTFVGSMNMDFRSSRLNTEIGVLVDSPELAEDVINLITQLRSLGSYQLRLSPEHERLQWVERYNGNESVHDDEPGVDLGTWLKIFFVSPFVSEGLL